MAIAHMRDGHALRMCAMLTVAHVHNGQRKPLSYGNPSSVFAFFIRTTGGVGLEMHCQTQALACWADAPLLSNHFQRNASKCLRMWNLRQDKIKTPLGLMSLQTESQACEKKQHVRSSLRRSPDHPLLLWQNVSRFHVAFPTYWRVGNINGGHHLEGHISHVHRIQTPTTIRFAVEWFNQKDNNQRTPLHPGCH